MSSEFSIRKAMEKVLQAAVTASGPYLPGTTTPAIAWPGLPFDPPKILKDAQALGKLGEYVRFSMHFAKPIVREIGPTPRIEQSGIAKVVVFTQSGTGQDRNDTIAGIVKAAYPYGLELVEGGYRVKIDTIDTNEFIPVDAWSQSSVNVNWNVWRSTQ